MDAGALSGRNEHISCTRYLCGAVPDSQTSQYWIMLLVFTCKRFKYMSQTWLNYSGKEINEILFQLNKMTSLSHCFKSSVVLLGRMLHHQGILEKAAFWRRGKSMVIKFVGERCYKHNRNREQRVPSEKSICTGNAKWESTWKKLQAGLSWGN